ncbi:acyl-CoA dehydrogenase family protein [Streptomyces sp. NPDC057302]|uniref:acyl-CoA dehydrogenase family protein n=1 Tax=Streptomyces sp. NPDC057302 TaxID=3346094 RepID=UPI0036252D24
MSELDLLRETTRKFLAAQVTPDADQLVDREVWRKAGELGLLCCSIPEEYGGGGADFDADLAVFEEQARAGDTGWGNFVHSGIVAHYLLAYGTEEQKQRWLPGLASGELVGAIAMTEPGAGSDLRGIRTKAVRDGDDFVLSGSKTFITNGGSADLVIVAARTGEGLSLIVVTEGIRRGRVLDKLGMHAADTSELFFDDVRVPTANLLGAEGRGLSQLMRQLAQERLIIGVMAVTVAERAVAETVAHVKERRAFGEPLIKLQNTRFELAECATLARVGRVFADSCVERHLRGELDAATASMAKWYLTDVQCQVIDRCLQLFGGYGYMREYPIARMYADARAQKIYGGANEVMKELIARSLEDERPCT